MLGIPLGNTYRYCNINILFVRLKYKDPHFWRSINLIRVSLINFLRHFPLQRDAWPHIV